MERITTDKPCGGMSFLNVFYGKDEEVWVRGGGPAPEYKDCSLYDFVRRISKEHGVQVELESDEDLGWQLYDMLEDGPETKEGLIAFFNVAAIQAAEMREHLKEIEDILGDTYDLDHLRELVEADRDGLISVITVPKGRICGTCKNFCRTKGKSYGVCSVRSFPKNRKGIEIQAKGKFTPYQSRPACKQYIFTDEGPEHYEMEGKK